MRISRSGDPASDIGAEAPAPYPVQHCGFGRIRGSLHAGGSALGVAAGLTCGGAAPRVALFALLLLSAVQMLRIVVEFADGQRKRDFALSALKMLQGDPHISYDLVVKGVLQLRSGGSGTLSDEMGGLS